MKNPAKVKQIQNRMKNMRAGGVDVGKILTQEERTDKEKLVAALEKRLLQAKLTDKGKKAVHEFLNGITDLDDGDIRDTIRLVMSTIDYQVT